MTACGCMGPMPYRSVLSLTAVVLVGVTGCSGADEGTSAPSPTSSPTALVAEPTAGSTPPPSHCGFSMPPLPNPDAPPYEGSGPHLVIIGQEWNRERELQMKGITHFSLPEEWHAYDEDDHDFDESLGELFVCMTGVRQREDTPIGNCEWEEAGDSPVYPATYMFEVAEARSGRELAAFALDSDASVYGSCPSSVLVQSGFGAPDVAQGFSEEALAAELEPFVMADLR